MVVRKLWCTWIWDITSVWNDTQKYWKFSRQRPKYKWLTWKNSYLSPVLIWGLTSKYQIRSLWHWVGSQMYISYCVSIALWRDFFVFLEILPFKHLLKWPLGINLLLVFFGPNMSNIQLWTWLGCDIQIFTQIFQDVVVKLFEVRLKYKQTQSKFLCIMFMSVINDLEALRHKFTSEELFLPPGCLWTWIVVSTLESLVFYPNPTGFGLVASIFMWTSF